MTTTPERMTEILTALTVAGAGWPDVARKLPEYQRHSLGIPSGPGVHRPWVLLTDDYPPYWDTQTPVRLVRHETGLWFLKGSTYLRDLEDA